MFPSREARFARVANAMANATALGDINAARHPSPIFPSGFAIGISSGDLLAQFFLGSSLEGVQRLVLTTADVDPGPAPVPEPSTISLLVVGALAGVGASRRARPR